MNFQYIGENLLQMKMSANSHNARSVSFADVPASQIARESADAPLPLAV